MKKFFNLIVALLLCAIFAGGVYTLANDKEQNTNKEGLR